MGAATEPVEVLFPDGAKLVACLGFCHPLSPWPVPASCSWFFKLSDHIYTRSGKSKQYKRVSDENKICLYPASCPGPASRSYRFNHTCFTSSGHHCHHEYSDSFPDSPTQG